MVTEGSPVPPATVGHTRPRGKALGALLGAGCPCNKRRTYTAPTAKTLLSALAGHGGRVKTMRTKAKVDQWTKKGRIKVRVYILTTAAGKLRFEVGKKKEET